MAHFKFRSPDIWLLIVCIVLLDSAYPQETDSSSTAKPEIVVANFDSLSRYSKKWLLSERATGEIIAEDVADYLQLVPGLSPLDHGSLGQVVPLTARGSKPGENDIWFGNLHFENPIDGFVSSIVVPINLFEKSHLIDADSFSPFSSQVPGATLVIKPYRFLDKRPYSRVNFRSGDWGYSDLGIIFGLPVSSSTKFMVSGNRQEFNGFEINRNYTGSRIIGHVVHRPNTKSEIEYVGLLNRHEYEIPAPLLPAFVPWAPGFKRMDSRFDQVLSFKYGERAQQLHADIYFSTMREQSFTDSLAFEPKANIFGLRIQKARVTGKHHLRLGGELKIYDLNSLKLGDHVDVRGSVFIQNDFCSWQNWRLGFLINLEKQSGYSVAFNPAIYLNYEPSKNQKAWVGIKHASRYPSFVERYWPEAAFLGNPILDVEKSLTFEIGFHATKNDFEMSSAFFAKRTANWIGASTNKGVFGPRNLDARTVLGSDLKLLWKYVKGGEFGFVSSYLAVIEPEASKQLQIPEFSIYSYMDWGGFFFDNYVYINFRLIGRIFGKSTGLLFENSTLIPDQTTLPPNGVLDSNLSFKFSDAKLFISIENLFSQEYELVPGFKMPPKTLRFGVTWEFRD